MSNGMGQIIASIDSDIANIKKIADSGQYDNARQLLAIVGGRVASAPTDPSFGANMAKITDATGYVDQAQREGRSTTKTMLKYGAIALGIGGIIWLLTRGRGSSQAPRRYRPRRRSARRRSWSHA